MSIIVKCAQCGTSCRVSDALVIRRVRCPACDAIVHAPEFDGTPEVRTMIPPIDVSTVREFEPTPVPVVAAMDAALQTSAVEEPMREYGVTKDLLRKSRPEEEMDMTPMVDVTFLLVIFFMVTAAFSLQKSIEMPRQQTDVPERPVKREPPEELNMVEVEIDRSGGFLVKAPDWQRETPGKQNLITALNDAIEGHTLGMRLRVKVEESARLHALVDAIDAGTIAGYAQLEVTQVEGFD